LLWVGEAKKLCVHKEYKLKAQKPVAPLCSPEDDTETLVTKLYCILIQRGQLEK